MQIHQVTHILSQLSSTLLIAHLYYILQTFSKKQQLCKITTFWFEILNEGSGYHGWLTKNDHIYFN